MESGIVADRCRVAWQPRTWNLALLAGNASVSGVAFIDAGTVIGTKDAGELVVRGIVVTLSNDGDTFNESVTTDANGTFTFFRVPEGTYTLAAQPGIQFTSAASHMVAVVGDTHEDNENIALGGLKPTILSLRQFLNTTTIETLPFEAAGVGRLGNEIPTALGDSGLGRFVHDLRNADRSKRGSGGDLYRPGL